MWNEGLPGFWEQAAETATKEIKKSFLHQEFVLAIYQDKIRQKMAELGIDEDTIKKILEH